MENAQAARRAPRADGFVLVLLAISLVGNVVLGVAVARRERVGLNRGQVRVSGPAVGTRVPALDVQRLNGGRERVTFASDGRPTLIYVFSPTCVWCSRNLDNVTTLVAAAEKSHRVIGVSLRPDVADYIAKGHPRFAVYVEPSSETVRAYSMESTPLTIVVSPEGIVLKSWSGAYAGRTKKEVESYFNVKLPGIMGDMARAPEPARSDR